MSTTTSTETLVITGASGQLGRLVLAELRSRAPNAKLVGLVRDPAKAPDLAALGVELRVADYENPASLVAALRGADKLLLISSSEIGRRLPQHRNVIDAAKAAGVKLLAYTSILRADTSPMNLAVEHKATEDYLRASGLPHVLLRNGWYTENYTGSVGAALQHGVVLGAAGEGRIASAARADYAAAAAVVLASTAATQAGKVYELAGDSAYTLSELAAEIARQSGKPVAYKNLSEAEYKTSLEGFGLPPAFAGLLAESDVKAAAGSLYDDGKALSRLIGRLTVTLTEAVAAALK
ncbi:SDR family oxidoreductase [Stagnimonas aquatica]|uniref:SDR family oxidoreductase n=1 Tax=Stagnimonas aquatica TaxID=2689987 RepID=A0A3N0UYV8_9GAMM|nr:SDR family oxidoreductase [Stagnimonas aquatica]ROH85615.1 SDR family oxidoreductase [Stagnimonas aquatica]